MYGTRRYRAVVALAAALVAGGVVLARPVLVIGATMIGAWLLGRHYAFVRALDDVADDLSLTQELASDRIVADQPTPLSLVATLHEPTPLELTIEPGLPIATATDRAVDLSLEPGDYQAEDVVDVRWPIAGTFRFNPPTIHARDPFGLFEGRIDRGPTPTVTVEPQGLRDVHLGKGGDPIRRSFSEHEADPLEGGLEPAEIREYVSGDAARLIDWNVTARMDRPYVRTFETNTDRQAVLFVDHRGSMATGSEGETKLDYARDVALSIADRVQRNADPIGLYAIGEEGVSVRLPPRSSGRHYASVRSRLHDLAATPNDGALPRRRGRRSHSRTRRIDAMDDASTFATRLRSYAGTTETDTRNIGDDPLLAAVKTQLRRIGGRTWTVIISDDAHRTELREATLFARRNGNRVLVVLAPTVLFESDGLADLAEAYDRYGEFETFRRSLDRLERVSAIELAPSDRLTAVLAAGRTREAPA